MTILKHKKILIVDSDICNVGSVYRAVKKIGYESVISKDPEQLKHVSHIILPGVGSFTKGMQNLNQRNLGEALKDKVLSEGTPLLGICLGMHLLGTTGYENEETSGLNLIPGNIKRLNLKHRYKIPHIGWNEVSFNIKNALFNEIPNKKDFYFVHSFSFEPQNNSHAIATTEYDKKFISVINKENIYGVQFQPEKSLTFGIKLIENFISI